ncbi:FAD binding domain-containing protein [Actinosynnema sp. NPDC047251]|uniref:Molybdopterin dehydrogenase FAD-binding protein n=1 Tax=Saccharothrix espanaensis (strain ATCC 51144 / DSM 44229 / JCM 9112 / NBRC 15066 / NRRL 15764) TaxID=1179773 RepID=K0JV75_SACES|nr:FAD binding domain-containing protein [Saccharothrix espanaensis]CCH31765.1 Molybdopterin dehydrogenase FAD-binding protein [Saccharothrix espanaensis DSM 44229]
MKAAPFEYLRPSSVAEAVAALGPGSAVLAGGQSLVPLLNLRARRPALVVDVSWLPLAGVERTATALVLGALTRLRAAETSPVVRLAAPLLAEALTHVANVSVRNRGTVGGSVAHADPAAELPAVLLAADAVFTAHGPAGTRTIDARDFFLGPHRTALAADELLTAIRVPLLPSTARHGMAELSRRPDDLALAAVFTSLVSADGVVTDARVAVAGAAPTPIRAHAAERLLRGAVPTPDVLEAAAEAAAAETDPVDDVHAPAAYRRDMTAVLTRRALRQAVTE